MPKVTISWEWVEAFDKFGFNDGDGLVFTDDVVSFLKTQGYECACCSGIHNYMICEVAKDGQTWEFSGYPDEDEENPRRLLPPELVKALDERFK
ncbi:MAG: hypothetical protein PHQ43_14740 [Dehalococcoidales bacterium]|nr:hypothetical protein [Dehalococcoidales bacterium]